MGEDRIELVLQAIERLRGDLLPDLATLLEVNIGVLKADVARLATHVEHVEARQIQQRTELLGGLAALRVELREHVAALRGDLQKNAVTAAVPAAQLPSTPPADDSGNIDFNDILISELRYELRLAQAVNDANLPELLASLDRQVQTPRDMMQFDATCNAEWFMSLGMSADAQSQIAGRLLGLMEWLMPNGTNPLWSGMAAGELFAINIADRAGLD